MIRTTLAVLLLLPIMAGAARAQPIDTITQARRLAFGGRRADAIQVLRQHLATSPTDDDARVLLGTVLSWERQFDEARSLLDAVLKGHPTNGDARLALLNVELRSGHPQRAKELADVGLGSAPNDGGLLDGRRRAIDAIDLQRPWSVSAGASYDWFSDHRTAWQEQQAALRRMTRAGALIVRGSRAERFGLTDNQVEVEMYPRFRSGTYAYVSGGYAPARRLYPEYRIAADLYQSLGAGFEGSIGYRRLMFATTTHIYVGTLNKYAGNWLLTGRMFYVPDRTGASSRSYQGAIRRYFGAEGTSYIGARYGYGLARDIVNLNDFEVLHAKTVAAELQANLGRRLQVSASGGTSRQERLNQGTLDQQSASVAISVRF